MTNKIDDTDKALLYCLLSDARTKESQLAKLLKVSKQVVSYRIKNLVEKKYIRSFRISTNPSLLGKIRYSILLRINEDNDTPEVRRYLKSLKGASSVIECIGNWNVYASYWVDSPAQFDSVMESIFTKIPVKGYVVLESVYSALMFGRVLNQGFSDKIDDKGVPPQKKVTLDEIDRKLLELLNKNSRAPLIHIARELSISVHVLKYHLERLKKSGFLQRCFAVIDMQKLGYQEFTCLCKINLSNPFLLKKFIKYLRARQEVSFYMRCIGAWDFYLSVFVKSPAEFREVIHDLRQKFRPLIMDSDMFIIDQLF